MNKRRECLIDRSGLFGELVIPTLHGNSARLLVYYIFFVACIIFLNLFEESKSKGENTV